MIATQLYYIIPSSDLLRLGKKSWIMKGRKGKIIIAPGQRIKVKNVHESITIVITHQFE